jgi:DNA-binding LacI/PurR family transcriptional regulator
LANIREIAKKAGVSASSVSRILSGDKNFSASQETRKAVFKAVEELEYVYVPIPRDRHKIKPNAKRLGCIITSAYGNYVDLLYNSTLLDLRRKFSEKGFEMSAIASEMELQNEDVFQKNFQPLPVALIYMADISRDSFERTHAHIPCSIGYNSSFPEIDNITFDKEKAIENAVAFLAGKGHKKIAYIGGPGKLKADLSTSRRYQGFRNGIEKSGLELKPGWIKNCYWLIDECYKKTNELLNNGEIPDAIVCGSDNIVFSVYRAIYEKQLRIPKDIAVFSCEKLPVSRYITPALSTIEVPVDDMNNAAVELLVRRINGLKTTPMEIVFRTRMVIQSST